MSDKQLAALLYQLMRQLNLFTNSIERDLARANVENPARYTTELHGLSTSLAQHVESLTGRMV